MFCILLPSVVSKSQVLPLSNPLPISILPCPVPGQYRVGADICGFFGETTPELCKRWMQLGAFYPYSRNHNTLGSKPQGPGQLGDDVGNASRDIMRVRYKLLPYLYFLFVKANRHGSTVVRPLHHEFPTDQTALSIDRQFLWGSCLLISPILEQGQAELAYYLPKGKWFNYFTHVLEDSANGAQKKVPVDAESMPLLHLRGGCVIVEQEYANNTHFSRQKPLTILAALDADKKANGGFFWDDGVSKGTMCNGDFYEAKIVLANNSLHLTVQHKPLSDDVPWTKVKFDKLVIMGVEGTVKSVRLRESPKDQGEDLSFTKSELVLQIELGGKGITQYDRFEVLWSY
ncbi:lysosomal alpha-glucosidase protein [Elysia marginata]|uniref:Lysosomal alpha-glucosidase protein n=1 Tax=Elysia marginata TaxID=1093978 RepID=A0AAV4JGP1_9GAST|nr:lysosomal alpha-glucosidase protein [Elysia marginata]